MRKRIEELMAKQQIGLVGFGDVTGLVPPAYADLGTAVSFAVRLSEPIMDRLEDGPTHEYFHLYRTVNRHLDMVGLQTALMLEEAGHRAMYIPASQSINDGGAGYKGLFSHRTAATRAGQGWIGKSNSLVTFKFGPRVRLGTVLTDWRTTVAQPVERSYCGECNLCVDACPALALSGQPWAVEVERERIVDVVACSGHMKKHYHHIGRGVVCGICVSVCPVGRER